MGTSRTRSEIAKNKEKTRALPPILSHRGHLNQAKNRNPLGWSNVQMIAEVEILPCLEAAEVSWGRDTENVV